MPARTRGKVSVRPSIHPPVRLSVKRVICDETNESCANLPTPHERTFTLVLWQEGFGGRRPLLPKILDQAGPVGAKTPIFNRYSLVALSHNT